MIKRQVFYSFHYDNDVMRVHQIRNIGALDGNRPASPNDWEVVKSRGEKSIKNWIDDNMHYRSCVIVLIIWNIYPQHRLSTPRAKFSR